MHNTLFSTLCNKNTNNLHALYIVQHGQRVTGMAWGPNSNRLVTCGAVSTQRRQFFIVNVNKISQSRQVKCTPQDSSNELIIWKMNPLIVPVTSFMRNEQWIFNENFSVFGQSENL